MKIFNDHVIWTLSDKQEVILSACLWVDDVYHWLSQALNWRLQCKSESDLLTIVSFHFLPVPAHWGCIKSILTQLPLLHADYEGLNLTSSWADDFDSSVSTIMGGFITSIQCKKKNLLVITFVIIQEANTVVETTEWKPLIFDYWLPLKFIYPTYNMPYT